MNEFKMWFMLLYLSSLLSELLLLEPASFSFLLQFLNLFHTVGLPPCYHQKQKKNSYVSVYKNYQFTVCSLPPDGSSSKLKEIPGILETKLNDDHKEAGTLFLVNTIFNQQKTFKVCQKPDHHIKHFD